MKEVVIICFFVISLCFQVACGNDGQDNASAVEAGHVENFDFRRTKWGMTMDEVLAQEDSNLALKVHDGLLYEGTLHKKKVGLFYYFKNNKLESAMYLFEEGISVSSALAFFNISILELKKKYGNPTSSFGKIESNTMSYEEILEGYETGKFKTKLVWDIDKTIVSANFYKYISGNDFILLTICYESKEF